MRSQKRKAAPSSLPADILMALPDLGIQVTKVDEDEAWALCPGPHARRMGGMDSHPSWSVNLVTGAHHCFSCSWSGPFIGLVKFVKNMDDEKASRWIKDHGGMLYAKSRLEGRISFEKKKAEEVTEARLIMFDDPPKWARREKRVSLASCLKYGVRWNEDRMVLDENHTIPAETWIFPIRDPDDGHLMGWQEKGKGHFRNYPKHVEKAKTVFGLHVLKDSGVEIAYLEESPIDAVMLDTLGYEGGISTYGAGFSDEQVALISNEVDHLVCCFDNDSAGRVAEREMFNAHRHRFRKLDFAVYDRDDPKDHGEMDPEDVELSIRDRQTKMTFRA